MLEDFIMDSAQVGLEGILVLELFATFLTDKGFARNLVGLLMSLKIIGVFKSFAAYITSKTNVLFYTDVNDRQLFIKST